MGWEHFYNLGLGRVLNQIKKTNKKTLEATNEMTEPSLYKNFKFLKGLKGGGDTQKTN